MTAVPTGKLFTFKKCAIYFIAVLVCIDIANWISYFSTRNMSCQQLGINPKFYELHSDIEMPDQYMVKKAKLNHGHEQCHAADLDLLVPTRGNFTLRLYPGEGNRIGKSKEIETWQLGVVESQPDVMVVSESSFEHARGGYLRETYNYRLMQWILRVYREDKSRETPLIMVDAGANHGLFSLVAGASGAHAIALEPQPHMRSVIHMSAVLNGMTDRVRVLPFAILDKYKRFAMKNVGVGDGGVTALGVDTAMTDKSLNVRTIRLDALPKDDLLYSFTDNVLVTTKDIGHGYPQALKKAFLAEENDIDTLNMMPEALSLRQPIQFLKIDVEGFELHALESASKLFERNLVDNVLIEFGPHSRWMNTLDPLRYDKKERRRMTIKHCRRVLHQMTGPWGFDLYILPSDGFEATAELFKRLELDLTPDGNPGSFDNRVFHKLFAHDFNGKAFPADDPFAVKMKQMDYHVTDLIPLKKKYIDNYSNDLEDMGEIYLWAIRRDSPGAKIILEKKVMA